MRNNIKAIILICLFIGSCTNHKKISEIKTDSLYWDFFVHSENQIASIHFPLKVTDNGTVRTINKSEWVPYKEYNGFVRIFCSEELFKNFKINSTPGNIVLDYITPEDNLISQMTFYKQNNGWQLEDLKLNKENLQDSINFIGFLNKFMGDSIFRKERILFPLEYSELVLDDSSDYKIMTGYANDIRTLEKQFDLRIKTKVIILIKDHDDADCKGDSKILSYQEAGTSTNIAYYFKNINSKWYLIKYENFSL